MTSKKYTLAEFFCGCGGTSRGFTRSGRFNVAFGNDVKNEALRTFEFNHARDDVAPATVRKDIRLLDVQTIHDALKDRGIAKGDLDCMIGDPPVKASPNFDVMSTAKRERSSSSAGTASLPTILATIWFSGIWKWPKLYDPSSW